MLPLGQMAAKSVDAPSTPFKNCLASEKPTIWYGTIKYPLEENIPQEGWRVLPYYSVWIAPNQSKLNYVAFAISKYSIISVKTNDTPLNN
jgi:hypothetical protein